MLSVVIPAYNEGKRIGRTLSLVRDYLNREIPDYEVIIVDDGSSDDTPEIVRSEARGGRIKTLRNDSNRGKGYSVRRGVLESAGDHILFSDADLSTPIEDVKKLLRVLDQGYDVAIGSRALSDSQVEVRQNIVRESMGKIFNLVARLFLFKDIKDSQCGFKAFRRDAARRLFKESKVDGFSFDAEIIFLAQRSGMKIKEVPVTWRNSAQSRVHIFLDPVRMFWDVLRIRALHCRDEKN